MKQWWITIALCLPWLSSATEAELVLEKEASPAATVVELPHEVNPKGFTGPVVRLDHKESFFHVTLPENPSTGFRWYLSEYNDQLLEPVSSSYVLAKKPAAQKKLIGAPGVRTFIFQVKTLLQSVPQKTLIRFEYRRPWSPEGEEAEEKVVTVYSLYTQGAYTH